MPNLVKTIPDSEQQTRHISVGNPYRNDGNGFKNLKTPGRF